MKDAIRTLNAAREQEIPPFKSKKGHPHQQRTPFLFILYTFHLNLSNERTNASSAPIFRIAK